MGGGLFVYVEDWGKAMRLLHGYGMDDEILAA